MAAVAPRDWVDQVLDQAWKIPDRPKPQMSRRELKRSSGLSGRQWRMFKKWLIRQKATDAKYAQVVHLTGPELIDFWRRERGFILT